jgi:DnaJ-class molecular chaperone
MSPSTKKGPKHKPLRCGWCNGTGSVTDGRDERGRPNSRTCNRCGGTGEI